MSKTTKKSLAHLATWIFDTPLMIHRSKLDVILSVLGPRFNLEMNEEVAVKMENSPRRAVLSAPPMDSPGECVLAVIPIYGTLVQRSMGLDALSGLCSYGMISDMLQDAVDDDTVDAIVLDIDSPGGMVNGAFDLAAQIKAASGVKPVYAVVNEQAFSAAYLMASAADKIYLPQTGNVGSIGVIATHVDVSKADEQDGYKYTHIIAGDYKADGTPHQPLSDRALGAIQGDINSLYDLFTQTVAENREMTVQQVVNTKAATFLGKSAVNAGLADQVMSTTDAMNAIATEVIQMKDKPATPAPAPAPAPAAAAPATAPVADPPAPASAAAAPAPAAEPAARDFSAEAAEISEACMLGGMPQLASEFIRKRLSPAQAKAELFDRKSRGEPAIISAAAPDVGGGHDAAPDAESVTLLKGAMEKVNKDPSLADKSGAGIKLF